MLDMTHISEIQNLYIKVVRQIVKNAEKTVRNVIQFVEIFFNFWYNKVSETNTF